MKGKGSAVDLSRRALSLKISSTVAVAQRAAALRAAGESVLDFSVGEPDQPTPAHIKDAAAAALSLNRTRYTPAAGIPELRAAVAMRYRQDFNVTFGPEEVAATIGGKQALYLACNALLDRGDEVVIPTPHWPTFSEAVRLAGGRPVIAQTREKDGFRVTARLVAKALTTRTRAVLVNSPGNPTGAVIEDGELLAIAKMAQRQGFTLLYDDTYARMTFGDAEPPDLQEVREAARDRFVILGDGVEELLHDGVADRVDHGPARSHRRLRGAHLPQHPVPDDLRAGGRGGSADRPPALRGRPDRGVPAPARHPARGPDRDRRAHLRAARRRLLPVPQRDEVPVPQVAGRRPPRHRDPRGGAGGGGARRGLRGAGAHPHFVRPPPGRARGRGAPDRRLPGNARGD